MKFIFRMCQKYRDSIKKRRHMIGYGAIPVSPKADQSQNYSMISRDISNMQIHKRKKKQNQNITPVIAATK